LVTILKVTERNVTYSDEWGNQVLASPLGLRRNLIPSTSTLRGPHVDCQVYDEPASPTGEAPSNLKVWDQSRLVTISTFVDPSGQARSVSLRRLTAQFGAVCQSFLGQSPTDPQNPREELLRLLAYCSVVARNEYLAVPAQFYQMVADERTRQDAKWGAVETESGDIWFRWKMIVVLGEEVGEACEDGINPIDLLDELVQIAAVCMKMVQMGDYRKWWAVDRRSGVDRRGPHLGEVGGRRRNLDRRISR
jgi:hypothetical protein